MSRRPPDEARLYQAALNHLARYAATEASLKRVLERAIERWAARSDDGEEAVAQAAGVARRAVPRVIARLQAAQVLDDAGFAASRARRLTREGKSRRFTLAHLAAKGVPVETASALLAPDPERELAAACAFLRRRRAGPFGEAPAIKTLAAMARAGFAQATARAALAMDREEAEARIRALLG
jgi:regulatory protein